MDGSEDERLRARAAELEEVNRRLAEYGRLVEGVRDYAIFMLDPTGRVRTWNTGARRLKGYAPGEIVGRHFSVFYTPQDVERRHPARVLEIAAREGRYEEEGWRVRRDGTRFWANVVITAVHDDERLVGYAKVTRDLTERRSAEQALHAAVEELRRANAELDRFASVAAHDMTDPLRTISGFAELLEDDEGLSDDERREFARHIRASSLRLSGMLDSLLDYARAGHAGLEPVRVAVAEVVSRVLVDLTAAAADRGADVTVHVPGDAVVLADAREVGLVVQNLVSNALKFAAPGRPVVAVRAERAPAGRWTVVVEDNGPGIPAGEHERIFEPFHRVDDGERAGYGLGLAICRRVVARHGGSIGVDSSPGGGSRFWFALPAADAHPAPGRHDGRGFLAPDGG